MSSTKAHTDGPKGICKCLNTRPKKIACGVCTFLLVFAVIFVPIFLLVIYPNILLQKFKDELSFYPCDVKMCSTAAITTNSCPAGMDCYYGSALFTSTIPGTNPPTPTCVGMAGQRAQTSERVGMEILISAYNAIPAMDIEHLAIVLKDPAVGMAASLDESVSAEDYIAGGSLVACVLSSDQPANQGRLAGTSWSYLNLHCEAVASVALAPVLAGFLSNTPINAATTYAAKAKTALGTKSLEGTYVTDPTATKDIQAASTCPGTTNGGSLDATNTQLASAGASGYQCAVPGSASFQTTLGACSAASPAVKTSSVAAFLCCIVKSLDGIGLMNPILCAASGGAVGCPSGR